MLRITLIIFIDLDQRGQPNQSRKPPRCKTRIRTAEAQSFHAGENQSGNGEIGHWVLEETVEKASEVSGCDSTGNCQSKRSGTEHRDIFRW
jgi:hypothetical protein